MDFSHFSTTLVLLVLLALAFDFMNGFHDAANSIATVVSTGVLKPWQAVLWAAFFNVLAWAFFELSVAATDSGKNAQARTLKNAAQSTACHGFRTPVDTTVAIEFAASWKPFMKSNASASRTSNTSAVET